jgi:preprotein translocase subunit SecA
MDEKERKQGYQLDITYLTARQGGFDFLRDQIQYDREKLLHRAFHMAIVDEADFIMIDEARIPLVIAAETEAEHIDPARIDALVLSLDPAADYTVDRQGRKTALTAEGQNRVAEALGCGGIHDPEWHSTYAAVHVALHAHSLLQRDVDYLVKQ